MSLAPWLAIVTWRRRVAAMSAKRKNPEVFVKVPWTDFGDEYWAAKDCNLAALYYHHSLRIRFILLCTLLPFPFCSFKLAHIES